MNSFLSCEELAQIGFKSIGKNVLVSRKASIYGANNIALGNNVRIDDFCILSGKVVFGDFIHLAAYSAIYGGDKGVEVDNFCNISSRVIIYAISDDYSGESMTNPMIPDKYKCIISEKVIIKKHSIIGTNSTILPGSIINEGVAIGAHSLVKHECKQWGIYVGIPVKRIKDRSRNLLELENEFLKSIK